MIRHRISRTVHRWTNSFRFFSKLVSAASFEGYPPGLQFHAWGPESRLVLQGCLVASRRWFGGTMYGQSTKLQTQGKSTDLQMAESLINFNFKEPSLSGKRPRLAGAASAAHSPVGLAAYRTVELLSPRPTEPPWCGRGARRLETSSNGLLQKEPEALHPGFRARV